MTPLPDEARLREMLEVWDARRYLGESEVEALLNCALTVRRLERWLHEDIHGLQRQVDFISGPSIETTLRVHSVTSFTAHGPDLLAALFAALERCEEGK